MFKINRHSFTFKIIVTIFLSVIYGLAIAFFLQPSHLISMGLTGIAQLVSSITNLNFGMLYFLLNIPGIILSFCKLGKRFTCYSVTSIIVVTLTTDLIPLLNLPEAFTHDRILNCMFAAMIMGFALGGLLKIGSSSGGLDFYALYCFKRFGIPFSYINLPINALIVILSGSLFGIETMLYSIIFIIIREIILNVFYTNNQKIVVWIIGDDLTNIANYIHNNIGRGTSIFKAVEGGYTHNHKEVIMVVLNVFQFAMLKEEIHKINPNVFVSATKVYDVLGNYRVNK